MKQNNDKMRLIGITGGIGAGKSEILAFIGKHYRCKIYLADQVAHKVKEPGQPAYRPLVELLGEQVLDENGEIHRGRMADRIFSDAALLKKVNEIVHPAVRLYLENAVREARRDGETELFFIEAALLIEAGYQEMVDELWYIHADREIREKRLRESRGYSHIKIRDIMEKQLDEEAFRRECDFVIDNSGKLWDAYSQIRRRLDGYTWLAAAEENLGKGWETT